MLRQHAEFFLMLAEEAALELQGPDQGWWLAVLEREHDNLRAAIRWAHRREETEIELRLAIGLSRFWHRRGYLREGRAWLEEALAASGVVDAGVRTEAFNYAGIFAETQGDYDRARALHEQSLALARELGDRDTVGDSLNNLGVIALDQGEYKRALPLLEESLAIARELKDRAKVARGLHNLAEAAIGGGEYEQGERLFEESLKVYQELGSKQFVAGTLRHLGRLKTLCGEYDRATELCKEALMLADEVGGKYLLPLCLETLASAAGGTGKVDRAVRLWGAADALRAATGVPLEPVEQVERDKHLSALRAVLAEPAFAFRWGEGRTMTPDRAVAYALEDLEAV